jgi:HD-like signal output (HDOD) protein
MKTRILFVDDEEHVLKGLQRMLFDMDNEWSMRFVTSGEEALKILDTDSFDVAVCDLRMPGMTGEQLLRAIQERHPEIIRFVLSGQSKQEDIIRMVGPAHQYLSKPCDAEELKATVARSCALRGVVATEAINRIVSQIESLPSLPSMYFELTKELQSAVASIRRVGDIISRDVGMTAKILKLVNSSYFGLPRHVDTPASAAMLLGLDTIIALVFSVQAFSQFGQNKVKAFSIDDFTWHSIEIGTLAKAIATEEKWEKQQIDHSHLAGLLHDCGKLLLATTLSEQYESALGLMAKEGIGLTEAERKTFGATHAEVGAALLGIWGLPDPIIEAVALHHTPNSTLDYRFGPLTAVHAANGLNHENGEIKKSDSSSNLDLDYLTQLHAIDRLSAWRELSRGAHGNERTKSL